MSIARDVTDPAGARHCPNCGASRPGRYCPYCGYPYDRPGGDSPTTGIPFTTYLRVAAWAAGFWILSGVVPGIVIAAIGLSPAGGAVSGLVGFAAGIWVGGRRYRLRTVSQWAIATAVAIGVVSVAAWILVQVVIVVA